MNDAELLRYSRHLLLDGFDEAGQQRLLDASVLVVGAGGLGCPAAMYLAASGVGRIVIADGDSVELSNLQRQVGHGTVDIGREKVQSLADTVLQLNPGIHVKPLAERLAGARLAQQVTEVDLVLDCSDNFATRLAVNRACVAAGKPLVSGAAIRAEGQVGVFNLDSYAPCYVCLYGEHGSEDADTCTNNGVLSPLVGVVGSLQALEAVKILAQFGETCSGYLLLLDARVTEWRKLALQKDPACPVCCLGFGG